MPPSFEIQGPFRVPREAGRNGNWIKPGCPDFWEGPDVADLADECGCYLFGIRAGGGIRPVYVGKATKTFRQECFSHHKIASHYTPALAETVKGTPVLFLVVLRRSKGRVNKTAIASVERFLIANAARANPGLSNILHKPDEQWSIGGVVRSGGGRASDAAKQFKAIIGL